MDNYNLHLFDNLTVNSIKKLITLCDTPFYLYDEKQIIDRCRDVMNMPNAFGIKPRYAMKANSNSTILKLIARQNFNIDASSLNEVRRANLAGIKYDRIMLTTQEIPADKNRKDLERMILKGLKYNVCSIRQLEHVADFASKNKIKLAMRVHPGVGSGESATRNTGDKYSCFGIHLSDIDKALLIIKRKGIIIDLVHVHIGSGGDPEKWKENIDRELGFVEKYFPDASVINFGGGIKVARMPDEKSANIFELGSYAKKRIEEFYKKTGRKLIMEVEPGTFIIANAGYLITEVIDKKQTGNDGFKFIIINGGMEVNTRPLLYGSRHPFYIINKQGVLISNEFDLKNKKRGLFVVVGRCCESGDSQTLDGEDHIIPRNMNEPQIGDYFIIGGTGAYCSSMSPFNYNSHLQAAEVLLKSDGSIKLIRKKQTIKQLLQNEI